MAYSQISTKLLELNEILGRPDLKRKFRWTIGFDGFVDEIIEVVDQRMSSSVYSKIQTIEGLGSRISRSANLSTNIELVPRVVKLGGNGPIMANALCATGQRVSYLGALGTPQIEQVFAELVHRCEQVFSFCEPAHTDALEFNDGKIMLGKLDSLKDITWENLLMSTGEEQLRSLFTQVDMIATVNWTMIPHMNQLWASLINFIAAEPPEIPPYLFIDLADPEKRSLQDKAVALELMKRFQNYYKVILGLNRKEASELARVLELKLSAAPEQVSILEITSQLATELGLWCVVVHSVDQAVAVQGKQVVVVPGPYTPTPVLTTGAGDNFNAGFCLGILLGLSLENALLLAKASSGFYVRQGYSGSFDELRGFIHLWAEL